jgi:hypothetical protein
MKVVCRSVTRCLRCLLVAFEAYCTAPRREARLSVLTGSEESILAVLPLEVP